MLSKEPSGKLSEGLVAEEGVATMSVYCSSLVETILSFPMLLAILAIPAIPETTIVTAAA